MTMRVLLTLLTLCLTTSMMAQKERPFLRSIQAIPTEVMGCSMSVHDGLEESYLVATLRWKECVQVQSGVKRKEEGDKVKEIDPASVKCAYSFEAQKKTFTKAIHFPLNSQNQTSLLKEVIQKGYDINALLMECQNYQLNLMNKIGLRPHLVDKCLDRVVDTCE